MAKTKEIEWGLIWGDSHMKHHDKRAHELLYRFSEEAKPDFHLHIGDLMNCAAVSRFTKNAKRMRTLNPVEEDFDAADQHWTTLKRINPNAWLVWMEGNHEVWLRDYAEENPEVGSDYDVEKRLRLKERGITFYPFHKQVHKPFRLGGLDVIHGWTAGIHHAYQTALRAQRDTIYGHTHDQTCHMKPGVNKVRHRAWSVGHLADEQSEAMRYLRMPTNWLRGFAIITINKSNGHTEVDLKDLRFYQFNFAGKAWKG